MKKIRYICADGPDGCGKTSQVNLLTKSLNEKGLKIHSTRLLGGDGTDDFQLALRKVLLHSKFPKDSVELEEQLFALTDLEGIKTARENLKEFKGNVVLKDRALMSHVAYALAKGMSMPAIEQCHRDVILAEKDIARRYGALHLIFIPDNVEWLLKRVASRSSKDGTEVVERLENRETQEKVVAAMRQSPFYSFSRDIDFQIIQVQESDSIAAVQAKVNKVLSQYDIGGEGEV